MDGAQRDRIGVLEAFSRCYSPIQAYLPDSLLSSLGLHAPYDGAHHLWAASAFNGQLWLLTCFAAWHTFWKSTLPDSHSGLEVLGVLQTTDLFFPG